MGFFKRLFSKSEQSNKPMTLRPPRVPISDQHRIFLQDKTGNPLPLVNVSVKGMGIRREAPFKAEVGGEIEGSLTIDSQSFPVSARVRHLGPTVAGCEYFGNVLSVRRAIESYFRLEILALNLRPVDESFLKVDPAGKVVWFTDGRENEVYCVTDGNGIVNFHLTFFDNYIEGGRTKPLRSGYVDEEGVCSGVARKGSALLLLNDGISPEMREAANTLIQNLEKMPEDLQAALRGLIGQATR